MKNKMREKNEYRLIIVIFFFSILLVLAFVLNIKGLFRTIKTAEGFTETQEAINNYMVNDIRGKNILTEIYGLTHNAIHLDIIGDFEFVRDNQGIMQRIDKSCDNGFVKEFLAECNNKLTSVDIPFVFVKLPDRGESFSFAKDLEYFGKNDEEVFAEGYDLGIDVFDMESAILENDPLIMENYFFKSDVHLTTQAEMENARIITEYLEEKYNLRFPMTDIVYNKESYDWDNYVFWGNLGRSSGKVFSGIDIFQTFNPKFETSFRTQVPSLGATSEGDFYGVITNGYVDQTKDSNLYWVTNYGKYPQPYYTYDNLLVEDGPSLLVISDSITMRTVAFLALNASHITVLDPRSFGEINYFDEALNNNSFDAAVLCYSDSTLVRQNWWN